MSSIFNWSHRAKYRQLTCPLRAIAFIALALSLYRQSSHFAIIASLSLLSIIARSFSLDLSISSSSLGVWKRGKCRHRLGNLTYCVLLVIIPACYYTRTADDSTVLSLHVIALTPPWAWSHDNQWLLKSAWLVTRKSRNVMYYMYVVSYCWFVVCINFRTKTWHVGAASIYNMFLDGRIIRILRLRWTAWHSLAEFIPWKWYRSSEGGVCLLVTGHGW